MIPTLVLTIKQNTVPGRYNLSLRKKKTLCYKVINSHPTLCCSYFHVFYGTVHVLIHAIFSPIMVPSEDLDLYKALIHIQKQLF